MNDENDRDCVNYSNSLAFASSLSASPTPQNFLPADMQGEQLDNGTMFNNRPTVYF